MKRTGQRSTWRDSCRHQLCFFETTYCALSQLNTVSWSGDRLAHELFFFNKQRGDMCVTIPLYLGNCELIICSKASPCWVNDCACTHCLQLWQRTMHMVSINIVGVGVHVVMYTSNSLANKPARDSQCVLWNKGSWVGLGQQQNAPMTAKGMWESSYTTLLSSMHELPRLALTRAWTYLDATVPFGKL